MAATVDQAMRWFERCLGTTESPPGSNRTRFGEHFGMNGVAWCAEFVWDGLANSLDVEHVKSAYTPTVADWYKQRGRGFRVDGNARRGDLVFFDFPDSKPRIQHIGIVVANNRGAGTLETIEGNTSSGSSGSQDNGGGVFRRTRPYSQAVYYGRPLYGGAAGVESAGDPKPNGKLRFERDDKGGDVLTWQRELNAWATFLSENKGVNPGAWFPLEEDGEFGANTETATKFFQGRLGLEEHGRVGVKTISAMERVRTKQWIGNRKKRA
jgi:peptidoglycan hydrolase-like protein with peptidoglycan-binding domain